MLNFFKSEKQSSFYPILENGVHSGVEFEFPIASTFIYKTNKGTQHNPTPGGHPTTSSPLKTLSVTQGSLTTRQPDQRLSPEDVLDCPSGIPQPFRVRPMSGPESSIPERVAVPLTCNQARTRNETVLSTTLYPKRE